MDRPQAQPAVAPPSLSRGRQRARSRAEGTPRVEIGALADTVTVVELPGRSPRPSGPRFGSLVHAALALVPLDANGDLVESLVAAQARMAAATDVERACASEVATRAGCAAAASAWPLG